MIRISVTGPESTGKSCLAEQLAVHYNTLWVPEYAREYLVEIDRPYTFDDILLIAQKQYQQEEVYAQKTDLLFCDTDFCVSSIWCTVKYGHCHHWITSMLEQNIYDLHLLCDIDLPWQYDPLREHPEMRRELFDMYENLLEKHALNYQVIRGNGDQRLHHAIAIVDTFLAKQKKKKM